MIERGSKKVASGEDPQLTLAGDASGTAEFTDLGDATLTVTVANDSHSHDTQYYTESETDTLLAGKAASSHTHSYLPLSGGSLTGDLTVDTNVLHVDTTNNRVGIGTASPSQTLHINSGTQNIAALIESTDANVVVQMQDNATTVAPYIAVTGDDFKIAAGNATRLTVTSSGDVGILTTTPSHRLDVNGDINAQDYVRVGGEAGLYLSGSTIQVGSAATGKSLALNAGLTNRVFIDSAGNVGIADTTPSYRLDVNGDIRATGVIQANTIRDNTGQQLVLEAGEGSGKFSGQTGEFVYTSSESGLAVYTPDGAHPNFQSGYVTRVSVLNGEFLKIFDGPTWYQSTQNYGTFNVQGYTRGSYYGVLLDQDANFMMNTAHSAGGIYWDAVNTWMFYSTRGAQTRLHYNGGQKMETASNGISVSGRTYMSSAAYGDAICGGSPNNIAFRWASPYIKGSVDNVVCATVGTVSDERFKKDIESWNGGIDIVRQLRPVTYTPRDITAWGEVSMNPIEGFEDRETKHGLIAQEVQEVMPTAVDGSGTISGYLSLNEDELIAMLISAVKNIDDRLKVVEA